MEQQTNIGRGYRAFQAIWDGENGDKLREIFSDCFQFHNLDGRNDVTDLKGLRERVARLRAANPWAHLRVDNAIGSGSHIAFDWTLGSPAPRGERGWGAATQPGSQTGSLMIRLDGECVEELWELNGALPA